MFGMYVLRNLLVIQNILLNILNYAMMVILAAVFSFVNHFSGRIAFYNPLVKGLLPNYEKAEKKTFPISFIWTNISLLRVNVQFK